MKYKITVNEKTYAVGIENINARPVIAHVDGERFEITPGDVKSAERRTAGRSAERDGLIQILSKGLSPAPNPAISGNNLTAPLPGTVVDVFVKVGDKVEAGQVVLIIEAMKMKNSIRSVFSGTISEVLVSAGQSVAHETGVGQVRDWARRRGCETSYRDYKLQVKGILWI